MNRSAQKPESLPNRGHTAHQHSSIEKAKMKMLRSHKSQNTDYMPKKKTFIVIGASYQTPKKAVGQLSKQSILLLINQRGNTLYTALVKLGAGPCVGVVCRPLYPPSGFLNLSRSEEASTDLGMHDPSRKPADNFNNPFAKEETVKKMALITAACLAAITSLALLGCSSEPIDELKMIGVAMDEAKNVEAAEYSPYDWDRARMQWEDANLLIQMGRYKEARDVLIEAIASFNTARDKAQRRVESLKIEIKALQSSAETELKKLEQAGASPNTKLVARNRIDRALPYIEEKVATMNADYDAKEYLRSRMAGQEAMRYVQDMRTRLGI